jgi:hypothetical protein
MTEEGSSLSQRINASRWLEWGRARVDRWSRESAWRRGLSFVWLLQLRPAVRVVTRVLRIGGSPLAARLLARISLTFGATRSVDWHVRHQRSVPGPALRATGGAARIGRRASTVATPQMTITQPATTHRVSPHTTPITRADVRMSNVPQRRLFVDRRPRIESRDIVSRVFRRTHRDDTEIAGSRTVLVRRPSPLVAAADVSSAPSRSREAWPFESPATTSPAGVPAPAVNVEHLTDAVLRQLDRRVTAWRERMGRV